MIGLIEIENFIFKKEHLIEMYSFLGDAGNEQFEAVALFAGEIENNQANIKRVIYPKQKTYKTEQGLMYFVDGDELHNINMWLHANKLMLIAQIHSHPTEAYHSAMDDEYAMISTFGGLSIVVPNFAQDPLDHLEWAYYRLSLESIWEEITKPEVEQLIKII